MMEVMQCSKSKKRRVFAVGLATLVFGVWVYRIINPAHDLSMLGLNVPVQRINFYNNGWFKNLALVQAELSPEELNLFLKERGSENNLLVGHRPSNRTYNVINCTRTDYNRHFIAGVEKFFPPYSPNNICGDFRIKSDETITFYRYVYAPDKPGDNYSLWIKAASFYQEHNQD